MDTNHIERVIAKFTMIVQIGLVFFVVCQSIVAHLIDLGHDLDDEIPIYPLPVYLANPFKLKVEVAGNVLNGKWLAVNSFSSVEHLGTHIDAPYHIDEFGWTLEQIPVQHFIAPVSVMDVREKAERTSNYVISVQDVKDWIDQHGLFPKYSVVLAYTGWGTKYQNATAYFGHDSDLSKFKAPGFSGEAVAYINQFNQTHGIQIYGYGIDTVSLDALNSTEFEAHRISQAANQYIIENLHNLDKLPPTGATIIVMPMRIKGGTGAPARVVAQLPFNSYVEQREPRIYTPNNMPCN